MTAFPPPPIVNAIADNTGRVTTPWNLYFQNLTQLANTNNAATVSVSPTGDITNYIALYASPSGNLETKTDSDLTYDAITNTLSAPNILGASFETLSEVTTTIVTRGTDTDVKRVRYNLDTGDCLEFQQTHTTGHQFGTCFTVRRVADYIGTATPGWFNAGLNVLTTTGVNTNTGLANELGIIGAIRAQGGGFNTGVFGQGWRTAGTTAWVWGLIADAEDQTGAESAAPVIGCEIDCFGNGVNTTYHNRVGLNIVTGMPTLGSTGVLSQCWHGIYLTAVNADNSQGYFKHGLHVGHDESLGYSRLTCDIGVKTLCDGTYGYWDLGSKITGLLLQGVYSSAALIVDATTGGHLPAGNAAGAIQVGGTDGGSAVFQTDSFEGSGNLLFRRADGTAAIPSAVQLDDGLGFIGARGYGTTGYSSGNRANIKFGVGSNWTDLNHETYVAVSVTPNGSTTLAEIARFNSGGLVVNASTGGAALPTRETGVLLQAGNADTVISALELDSFGAATQLLGKRAGGTIASKSALALNNALIQMSGLGYDGSAYSGISGSIQIAAANAWGTGDHSTYISFRTTSIGGTTIAEAGRIDAGANWLAGYTGTTGVIATNATDRMLGFTTCAGAPSGTPTAHTGMAKQILDTTNKNLRIWDPVGLSWLNFSSSVSSTFADNVFRIQDNSDATKQLAFELSGVSTGTTRTFTVPNFDGTIATLAGVEALSNKTTISQTGVHTINASTGTASLPTPETGVLFQAANANSTVCALELDAFGAANQLLGKRSQGTIASKTTLGVDNVLIQMSGLGYDGSAYSSIAGSFQIAAAGTWGTGDHSTYAAIRLTPIGSTTIAEKLRITDAGNLKIGGTANRGTTEGTNQIVLFNGTPPAGTLTNGGAFYSANGQVSVMDAAGLNTIVSSKKAAIDTTGLTANVGATLLYAVPSTGAGLYQISSLVVETTAGSLSSTLPNVQIVYTDAQTGGAVTIDATPILGIAGIGQTGALTANTIGTTSTGVIAINAKASTNINYQTVNYASNLAGMAYALHIALEAL